MGACPAHRGQSWSPRPRSRATVHSEGRAGRHEGKTARLVSQRTRRPRPAHQLSLHAARCLAERIASPSPKVVGRDTPKDAPARSNTLRSRRYRSQAARIYVEGRPYLAGRRGQRMRLACLDVRKRPPGYARDLRELPLGHPLLFAQAADLLAVHHQIHYSFPPLLVAEVLASARGWRRPRWWQPHRLSDRLLAAIGAAAARQGLDPLYLFARLFVEGGVAEVYAPVQARVRVVLILISGRWVLGCARLFGVHEGSSSWA